MSSRASRSRQTGSRSNSRNSSTSRSTTRRSRCARAGTRKLTQIKPLFPNYLFARLDLPEEWKTITFTRGVARVLGGWEDPRPIDESVVAAIRSQERRKDRLISYYRFKPRESVVVRSGPFKDVHGIFDRYIDEGGRVRILLSLIGYDAAVELESEQVSKL